MTFQDLLMCVYQDFPRPFSMSFQDCFIEWISNKSYFHTTRICNTVHNYTKQQIELSPTVDNDNVCKGRKHVHESEMRQPFGLISMTFHARPNSTTFQAWKIWILNSTHFHDLYTPCTRISNTWCDLVRVAGWRRRCSVDRSSFCWLSRSPCVCSCVSLVSSASVS